MLPSRPAAKNSNRHPTGEESQNPETKLLVGLGNPGKRYQATRHNVGFMVIAELAKTHGIPVNRRKFKTQYGCGTIEGRQAILAQPMAYMNLSGPPIQRLANYFRIQHQNIIVAYDDIDLDFGRIKIKEKGGHGGHKGVKSLMNALGGEQFTRVRVGVGRSKVGSDVSGHVLSEFNSREQSDLDPLLKRVSDAMVTILCRGTSLAMNQYNQSPR